ncbi:hypothetical protein FH966_08175 [Lentibacillus cibarius]|uniref:Phosphatase PAP2 family protein n=1 Tax=Lentibacillus cibarius TaxID=2583219 RepID=A0A549YIG4_9BACI|nr:hypothetical protein [Lentibacillus cibarius]TRM11660.1 hypothetical protein FH966_08175 [Lentibacillus cibarius]
MDWQLFTWIHSFAGRFGILDEIMKGLSSYTIYIFIGILILIACFSKKRIMAFVGIGGIVLGMLINYMVTLVYSRPRPFVSHDVVLLIDKAPSASFPSDTVMIAIAASFAIWFISRKVGWVFIAVSILVGKKVQNLAI